VLCFDSILFIYDLILSIGVPRKHDNLKFSLLVDYILFCQVQQDVDQILECIYRIVLRDDLSKWSTFLFGEYICDERQLRTSSFIN